ncbi:mandelate racemase/muconate lactonizing protein [Rhodococcus sp. NPDC057014]|uniref:mandelate racemase/muconate lactonizing protein n=1 Tax=Rhodococcus sp. NPDC057014 TaxID=3346000 RepID=UPI00362F60AA
MNIPDDHTGDLEQAQAKWDPIPEPRRREWCQVLLDFPPIWLGTFPMNATQQAVLEGRYTNISDWIDLAKRAEAAGFTPQTWLIFQLELAREEVNREFPRHPSRRSKKPGNNGITTTVVDPEEFADWPRMYEAGLRPSVATRRVLSGEKRL